MNFSSCIIYEDADWIIINKPAGIATLADRNHPSTNILKLAKNYCAAAQACHRLDKGTSGVLALAKNLEAYRTLSKQFEKKFVHKVYHAILQGVHYFKNESIKAPIYTTPNGKATISNKGKSAETIFHTQQTFLGYTLVTCKPITGRMHQIRLHATYKNAPIVGDVQYGGSEIYLSLLKKNYRLKTNTVERPLIQRAALHACAITFKNIQDKIIAVEAPYAKDFEVLCKQLKKYGL